MSLPDGGQRHLNTLLTFDIEVWCGGWRDIDDRFPAAFRRYIYGPSRAGNYALPKTLEMLNSHGLKGVFFVEPLFATHFGLEPLAEIVGLIQDAGQEIQLHLHTEWQDEAKQPLIVKHKPKRQHLHMYNTEEQTALIAHGLRLLSEASAAPVTAFRAGSFACNAETFTALERNGIQYDSSLNITMGFWPGASRRNALSGCSPHWPHRGTAGVRISQRYRGLTTFATRGLRLCRNRAGLVFSAGERMVAYQHVLAQL